ncbi:MAG: relaxase domain-containing protein [Pegethrix bostrychoides GSE-TBD4-15B]|jgi:Ti-type conjugative transfer relaxase TraA|uniref:Relaxase domain-containing protein n=1 Tax=Pegethrix bostrychoides GSE-TBD4-15B TaxID=2839662 RepID=A0A951P9Q9_9CYAN|nr:relaxase domain-containing protein [Pegethrix bostrychoides GSE-TBD4-15B]
MSSGQGNYYASLAKEDYYLEGGEPEGVWFGKGAKALRLDGTIKKQEFRNLFDGYSQNGERGLVQNAGRESRKPGWDLTFSAPKSLSVVWSQSDPLLRQKIQDIFSRAVAKGLIYLEENTMTRRGHDGLIKEKAGLVIATFEHGTSRAQDPQLHAHCLVMNLGVREDGTTGSITSKQFYTHKMAAGALFRAELAYGLKTELGLNLIREKTWFEVSGVPEAVLETFSKRREEIEQSLKESGFRSARAAEVAALNTRSVKSHKARAELFLEWQEIGKALGFGGEEAKLLFGKAQRTQDLPGDIQEVINLVSESITSSNSTFFKRDALRLVAEKSQGLQIGADLAKQIVEGYLKSEDVISLGSIQGEERFTTYEMRKLEEKMMAQVVSLSDRSHHEVSDSSIETVLSSKSFSTIRQEQQDALLHITQRAGAIQAVRGMAGTGKTYMLTASKVVWEMNGYEVRGISLSGKAVAGLEEAQIKSSTIAKFLSEPGLSSKTVLICDEAGMVGTRQMAEIIDAVESSHAKLILVGDERQLQSIDAGGAFRAISNQVGKAELSEITRQDEEWARQAVHSFADGNAEEGLKAYSERGLVTIGRHRTHTLQTIISDWKEGGALLTPQDHLILAGSKRDVAALNIKAQKTRLESDGIEKVSIKIQGSLCYEGDRIVFTKNSNIFQVKNGMFGTILKIKSNEITVLLDNKQKRVIPLRNQEDSFRKGYDRNDITLGYATTTHKAQGATVAYAYILTDEAMQNRELSYVQASRAKLLTRIYTTKQEAGEELSKLLQQMERTGQKTLSIEQVQ